jgi:hypothetical protein
MKMTSAKTIMTANGSDDGTPMADLGVWFEHG